MQIKAGAKKEAAEPEGTGRAQPSFSGESQSTCFEGWSTRVPDLKRVDGPSRRSLLIGSIFGASFGLIMLRAGFNAGSVILAFALSGFIASLFLPEALFLRLSSALHRLGNRVGQVVAVLALTPLFFLVFVPLRLARGLGGVLGKWGKGKEKGEGQVGDGGGDGRGGQARLPSIRHRPDSKLPSYWSDRKGGWSDLSRPFG